MSNVSPLVSAVVVCMVESDRDYIKSAIDSALGQTVFIEVIVVVNETLYFLPELESEFDGRVRFVRSSLVRLGKARNIALNHVRTEWVAFLDADDVWLKNKISVQLAMATKLNADLVGTCAYLVLPSGQRFGVTTSRYISVPSSWLVKLSVMRDFPFDPDAVPEDGPWWILTHNKIKKVRCGYPLINYCVRPNSLSSGMDGRKLKDVLSSFANKGGFASSLLFIVLFVWSLPFRKLTDYKLHSSWVSNEGG